MHEQTKSCGGTALRYRSVGMAGSHGSDGPDIAAAITDGEVDQEDVNPGLVVTSRHALPAQAARGPRSRADILAEARAAKLWKQQASAPSASLALGSSAVPSGGSLAPPGQGTPSATFEELQNIMLHRSASLDFGLNPIYHILKRVANSAGFAEFVVPKTFVAAEELCCLGDGSVCSNKELASELEVRPEDAPKIVESLANALASFDSSQRYDFERIMVDIGKTSDKVEMLFYMEYSRYDETPMQLVVKSMNFELQRKNVPYGLSRITWSTSSNHSLSAKSVRLRNCCRPSLGSLHS